MQTFQPIKIAELELSKPGKSFENLERYVALKALVRMHGTPVGYTQLGVTNNRCTSASLRKASIEKHGWSIMRQLLTSGLAALPATSELTIAGLTEIEPPVYDGPLPSVTVAVCTRNRAEHLDICLKALKLIDYSDLEIMVVDNAPCNDETRDLILRKYGNVKYVNEPHPGLSQARNRAIAEAQGDVIAFTDDDVIVDPGWVNALAQLFAENSRVMAVTGFVAPYELETEAQILFELHGGFGRGFDRQWFCFDSPQSRKNGKYHGAGRFGCGANMAFRRKLFDQIGHFDPALGAGTATEGGEDLDMFFRVLNEGYSLAYEPKALVFHRHRRGYEGLRKQVKGNGVGLAAYHLRNILSTPGQRFDFIKLHISWFFRWHVGRLLQSLTRPHHFPRDLILTELWGYLIGPLRYLKARRKVSKLKRNFKILKATMPNKNGKVSTSFH